MKDSKFYNQVALLLQVLPDVMADEKLALKGGTAINMFFREMPRMSIDIDLAYLPLNKRDASLTDMDSILVTACQNIERKYPEIKTSARKTPEGNIHRVDITNKTIPIKIDVNHVLRGSVFPPERLPLCKKAQSTFKLSIKANCMSFEDTYAGKMCAALERQHPRDLFDIKLLLENEGISDKLRTAFVVYAASGHKPLLDLLNPTFKEMRNLFEEEFIGMSTVPVDYAELLNTRETLIKIIQRDLSNDERLFLLSIKEGNPQWKLLNVEGIDQLPALQWKLFNIQKMPHAKHKAAVQKLKQGLHL